MNRLRADLHVHTCHSRQSGDFRFLRSRDCYSRPEEVYRVAKSRGMDLVAITDHNLIGDLEEEIALVVGSSSPLLSISAIEFSRACVGSRAKGLGRCSPSGQCNPVQEAEAFERPVART